jgi:nucleoside-triphosphatase
LFLDLPAVAQLPGICSITPVDDLCPSNRIKRPEIGYNEHMADLKKNIFLTGAPSSGKTTVIKKVIAHLPHPANGFCTEEERVAGKRVGFVMKTLEGRSGYLAHEDIQSDVPSITPRNRHIIILDEIGKMECFSDLFKQAALNALDSTNIVVGTITLGGDDFIKLIKGRGDIEIHEVTQENRNSLPDLILERVAHLLKQ